MKRCLFVFILIFLNVSCNTANDVSLHPVKLKFEDDSQKERYKIVSIQGDYGNISGEILLDTFTGETNYLERGSNEAGEYLSWRPIDSFQYSKSKATVAIKNQKLFESALSDYSQKFGSESKEKNDEINKKIESNYSLKRKYVEILINESSNINDFLKFIEDVESNPMGWGK